MFWIESERTVSELRKRQRNFFYCVHLLSEVGKFHVAVVQRSLKNVQKSVMHVPCCCFTNNINLLLFSPFSFPSPSLLPKLHFVVIQKFCYHGNVTSHFSPLFFGKSAGLVPMGVSSLCPMEHGKQRDTGNEVGRRK